MSPLPVRCGYVTTSCMVVGVDAVKESCSHALLQLALPTPPLPVMLMAACLMPHGAAHSEMITGPPM